MKTRIVAFSIACAMLFAESAAVFSTGAEAGTKAEKTKAADTLKSEDQEVTPQNKKVLVKAYQITPDNIKILLNQREMEPEHDTYSSLIYGSSTRYYSSSDNKNEDLPENTVLVSDWFFSQDGNKRVDRNSKLSSDQDHAIYYMTKQVPAHYLKFDAGEGKVVWQGSKPSVTGNVRQVADDEIVCSDQGTVGYTIPSAEWGTRRFLGWFTAPEGGEQITSSSVITSATEQTVYAHWDAEDTASPRETYTVTMNYMNDDGSLNNSSVRSVAKGDSYSAIWKNYYEASKAYSNYNKDDYEPGTAESYDWYTEKEGGKIVDRYTEDIVPGDISLYNRKELYRCHYISFDAGEGELFWNTYSNSYYPGNVDAAKNCQITVMEDHRINNLPSAENGTHAFLGWFTAPEGGTKVDVNTVYTEKGDMKLYAHWDAENTAEAPKGIKLRIYNVSSVNGELKVSRDYRGEDCVNYYEIINGKNSNTSSATVASKVSSSSNTTIPDGTTYKSAYFTEETGGQIVSIYQPLLKNEDQALYSRYDYVPYYHIQFDANGGKVCWNGYKSTSTFSNDRTLGDNEIAAAKGDTVSLPQAVNGTRKFLGWFTEPEGGEAFKSYTYITNYGSTYIYNYFIGDKDTTYYAHWDEEGTAEPDEAIYMNAYQLNSYTKEYRLTGSYRVESGTAYSAALKSLSDSTVYATKDSIPEGTIRKLRWYTEPQGGFCATSSMDTIPDHDFAVYAREENAGYHYITFDPCDGDLSEYNEQTDNSGPYVVTTAKVVYSTSSSYTSVKQPASNQIMVTEGNVYGTLLKAYQTAKKFLGWFTDPVGGTQVTEDMIFTGTSDQTLYAHYGETELPTTSTSSDSSPYTTTTTTSTTKPTSTTSTSTTKPTTTTTTSTTKPTTTTTTSTTKPTTTTTTSTTKPTTTTTTTTTSTTKPTTTTTTTTTSTTKLITTTTTTTTSTTKLTTTTTTTTTSTTKPTTTTTTSTTSTTKLTTAATTTTTSTTSTTLTSYVTDGTQTTVITSDTTQSQPEYLLGDVNDDGTVSVEDAQLALVEYVNSMSGLESSFSEKQKLACDINCDKIVSVDDAQNILLYYVKNTLSGQTVTWDELLGKNAPAQSLPAMVKRKSELLFDLM